MKFFIKDLTKTVFPADLVAFTEEILNEKLHFLCSVNETLIENGLITLITSFLL